MNTALQNQMPRTPSMHLALALGCHSIIRWAFTAHCSMGSVSGPGEHKPSDRLLTAPARVVLVRTICRISPSPACINQQSEDVKGPLGARKGIVSKSTDGLRAHGSRHGLKPPSLAECWCRSQTAQQRCGHRDPC